MKRYPAHPAIMTLRAELAIAFGDYAVADSLAAALPPGAQIGNAHRIQGINAAVQGRFDDAVGHFRAMQQDQLSAGLTDGATEVSIAIGRLQLVKGDRRAALAEVERFLARHSLDSLDPLDRPYFELARFFADAGHPARAMEILGAYDRELPREFRAVDQWEYVRTRAFIRVSEGKPDAAVADLERISRDPPFPRLFLDDLFIPLGDRPELARAYDRAGRADSAIVTYERYLGTRSAGRVELDAFELPGALIRLAELYEARGDSAAAARSYLHFAELWRNADAGLQPRVQEARKRAARLTNLEPRAPATQNR
jgi:tetratricopeptide (TPR) repeat protein